MDLIYFLCSLAELPPRPSETPPSLKCNDEAHTPKALAKYDFSGESDCDLSFTTGTEIILLQKVDEEWFQGCIGSQEGMFPAAFVEIIVPL
jgi:hypothetical protein